MILDSQLIIVAALPAFNEEATIGGIVLKALRYVDKVIVVDDGSSDETSKVASLAGALVKRHERNKGYGAALKTCFETARKIQADGMVILDADGQHDPDEIPIVLAPILSGEADVVIGSRFIFKNQVEIPIYRKIGIKILNLIMWVLGLEVLDCQSGFRAYIRQAINTIDPKESGMGASCEILLQAHKNGLRILEVPIKCSYNVASSTKNPLSHGLSLLLSLLKLSIRRQ